MVKNRKKILHKKQCRTLLLAMHKTGEKPCINKGYHALLMHRKITFIMIVPDPLQLFRHTALMCHNTKNGGVLSVFS